MRWLVVLIAIAVLFVIFIFPVNISEADGPSTDAMTCNQVESGVDNLDVHCGDLGQVVLLECVTECQICTFVVCPDPFKGGYSFASHDCDPRPGTRCFREK